MSSVNSLKTEGKNLILVASYFILTADSTVSWRILSETTITILFIKFLHWKVHQVFFCNPQFMTAQILFHMHWLCPSCEEQENSATKQRQAACRIVILQGVTQYFINLFCRMSKWDGHKQSIRGKLWWCLTNSLETKIENDVSCVGENFWKHTRGGYYYEFARSLGLLKGFLTKELSV